VAGLADAGDVLLGQFAVRAIDELPELARVNEERVLTAVTELDVLLGAG
jgi:hypothetical protein